VPDQALYCIYTARPGDTLSGIAASFGIEGQTGLPAAEILAQSNRPYITDTNEVFVGQKLRAPAASGVIHIVLEGETVDSLASAYGVTSESIVGLEINGLSGGALEPFEEIIVPNPTRIPPPVVHQPAEAPAEPEATDTPEPTPTETETPEPTETAEPTVTARARRTATPTRTPSSRRTPTPVSARGNVYKPADLRPILNDYSWPVAEALQVIFGPTPPNPRSPRGCPNGESAGNARIVGGAGERGLFQISPVHRWRFTRRGWSWADAFVPERNIAIAFEIYSEAKGWWPWSCRPK
jgi:LysM repeat protein